MSEQDGYLKVTHDAYETIYKSFTSDYIKTSLNVGDTVPLVMVLEATSKGSGVAIETEQYFIDGIAREEVKKLAKKYVNKLLDDHIQPIAVILASEAWIKHGDKKDKNAMNKMMREGLQDEQGNPREGVSECLIIAGKTFNSAGNISVYEIIRDAEKQVVDFVKLDYPESEFETGILDNFYTTLADKLVTKINKERG